MGSPFTTTLSPYSPQHGPTPSHKAIEPGYFERVAKKVASENDYSDYDLTTKYAAHRRKYALYDLICKKIENDGSPLSEEALIHAIGFEHMLRTLIVIGEEACDRKGSKT
jgi:hypothetical protein